MCPDCIKFGKRNRIKIFPWINNDSMSHKKIKVFLMDLYRVMLYVIDNNPTTFEEIKL